MELMRTYFACCNADIDTLCPQQPPASDLSMVADVSVGKLTNRLWTSSPYALPLTKPFRLINNGRTSHSVGSMTLYRTVLLLI